MFAKARQTIMALVMAAPAFQTYVFGLPSHPAAAALPDVETVLSKAKSKANDFAEQARMMQARVDEEQNRSRAVLHAAKEEYEHKLKGQSDEIARIDAENTQLHRDIRHLRRQSAQLEEEARTYVAANDVMRQSMGTMHDKVDATVRFLKDSLDQTNDAEAQELRVLESTTPKPTLDHFLKMAQSTAELALLQVESDRLTLPHASKNPEDLVQVLSLGLGAISSAEKEGAAQLKASFLQNFESGQKQKDALLVKQKELLDEKDLMNTTLTKFTLARDHVKETHTQLMKNMHGLRLFARKFDAMAASALRDGMAKVDAFVHEESHLSPSTSTTSSMLQATKKSSTTTISTTTVATTTSTPARKISKAAKGHPSMSLAEVPVSSSTSIPAKTTASVNDTKAAVIAPTTGKASLASKTPSQSEKAKNVSAEQSQKKLGLVQSKPVLTTVAPEAEAPQGAKWMNFLKWR